MELSRRACFILARNLGKPVDGRKQVIGGCLNAAATKYQVIDVFIIGDGLAESSDINGAKVNFFYLGRPNIFSMFKSFISKTVFRRWSLNESLFYSNAIEEDLRSRINGKKYDFVYSDMIRCANYASSVANRFHIDFDDRLSERYKKFVKGDVKGFGFASEFFNGYFGKVLFSAINRLSRWLFMLETNLISKREIYWAKKAHSLSFVSSVEASSMSKAVGRDVHDIPMSIENKGGLWNARTASEGPLTAVFVGSPDIPGNFISIQFFHRYVCEHGIDFKLRIVGGISDETKRKLHHDNFVFEGYVDDLSKIIKESDFYFAPINGGTGIKTKIVEALSFGIPIVTTEDGLSGLDIPSDSIALIRYTPSFFNGYESNYDVYTTSNSINQRVKYYEENFSPSVVENKWLAVFEKYD